MSKTKRLSGLASRRRGEGTVRVPAGGNRPRTGIQRQLTDMGLPLSILEMENGEPRGKERQRYCLRHAPPRRQALFGRKGRKILFSVDDMGEARCSFRRSCLWGGESLSTRRSQPWINMAGGLIGRLLARILLGSPPGWARPACGVGTLGVLPPLYLPPGKTRKTLPSLWPLGWSVGASGQTVPTAQKCAWGCGTLRRGTGQSCLHHNGQQMTLGLGSLLWGEAKAQSKMLLPSCLEL